MPTRNRRVFIPQAVACFQSQTWSNKELVVVDNGDDPIHDLLPPGTIYTHISGERLTTGAMRNLGCSLARGEYFVNYDDDDWSHPLRIAEQHKLMICNQVGIVGYKSLYFINEAERKAWLYRTDAQEYALGTSFFYKRDYWRSHKYKNLMIGEDNEFAFEANRGGLLAVDANDRMVARIHPGNTSPKVDLEDSPDSFIPADYAAVAAIMGITETAAK
jgi:glycosyltransferase involved in cell wall biosynthesis